MGSRALTAIAVAMLLAGCTKEPPAPPAATPLARPQEPAPQPKPAQADTSVPSVSGRSHPDCVGPIDLSVPAKVTVGGRKAELNGYKLTFLDKDADSTAVLGVLGNLNEDSGENLVNIKKYIDFFKAEKAEAILVLGDSGETLESIKNVLTPFAETGLPLFVLIGNRECRGDFNDAVSALQKTFPNVVNLNKVRYVDFDDVDLVSLPGYHDKRYIHCATGCQYFKQDVEALKAVAKAANDAVVLVGHGPPKGFAPTAIDAATGAGNVGDINVATLISEAAIPFGAFANIKEAGGRSTDLEGRNVIKEDTLVDRLFLNPGPADAVPWAMNDGTQSVGVVATLTVQGKQAKYKVFRAKPLTAEEKAHAAKLSAAQPIAAGEPKAEAAKPDAPKAPQPAKPEPPAAPAKN